jgi:hypothetical protein
MRHLNTSLQLLIVFVAALLLHTPVHGYEWDIDPWLAPIATSEPAAFRLTGLWPDTCVPRLENTRLVAETLEIRTLSDAERCDASETLFSAIVQLGADTIGARKITWWHRRVNEPAYQMYGYRLVDSGSEPLVTPGSGWWWPEPGGPDDSGGPGMGLTVDYQLGLLTILSQAYDLLGNPEWQLATGSLRGEVFNAPLIRFFQGQTLTGKYRLPNLTVGRDELSMQFHSPLSATAWFSHRRGDNLDSPIELRAVSMIRYIVNPPVLERLLAGWWLVSAQTGTADNPVVTTIQITAVQQQGTEQALIIGPDGELIGNCQLQSGRPEAAPRECTLTGLDLFGEVLINSVGFDRLHGIDSHERTVFAVRLPGK